MPRNPRPDQIGMGGRITPEYAVVKKNSLIERFSLFSVFMFRYENAATGLNAAVAELVDAQR